MSAEYGPCHVLLSNDNHGFIIFETKDCVESALEDLKGSSWTWLRSVKSGKREWMSLKKSGNQAFQVIKDPVLSTAVRLSWRAPQKATKSTLAQGSDGAVDDDRGHGGSGRRKKKEGRELLYPLSTKNSFSALTSKHMKKKAKQ